MIFLQKYCRAFIYFRGVHFQVAKKCGFKGYREFIYWYQKQFEQEQYGRLGDGNSLILNTYQELLNKTYSMINEEQIRRIGAAHLTEEADFHLWKRLFRRHSPRAAAAPYLHRHQCSVYH